VEKNLKIPLDFSFRINIIQGRACVYDTENTPRRGARKSPRRPWRETGHAGSMIHVVRRIDAGSRHNESFQPFIAGLPVTWMLQAECLQHLLFVC
jgi:hypothetical protein